MYRDVVERSSSQQHHLGMKCEVREQLSRVSLHAESLGPQFLPQRSHTPHPPSLGDAPRLWQRGGDSQSFHWETQRAGLGVVSVFTWAGIQGSAYSYRCNLSHHWQRTHPKLKALMSVSLAAKHWSREDGIRTSSESGDNSGSRKRYRYARFPSLASVLDSRALGQGHSKCIEAQKEVAQGAQSYIPEWSALV